MLTAGLLALSISSCKKNLILTPNDAVTQTAVFNNPTGITEALRLQVMQAVPASPIYKVSTKVLQIFSGNIGTCRT